MVFRRQGRPSWYFQAKTQTGYKQLAAGTGAKALAGRIEAMWLTLADEHRAWDLLGRVMGGTLTIGRLYDLWVATKYDVAEIRRRLNDTDVAPLVGEWHTWHTSQGVKEASADHALAHVRWLVPEGAERLASTVTVEWLTERLAAYPGKQNTRRKVHSSWTGFFRYCTRVRRLFGTSPMDAVDRPKQEKGPIQFYEQHEAERIVGWQPDAARRALFALLYGAAVEISVALSLTRADCMPERRSVRAPGTKAHKRDRISRVADWAWPLFWQHAQTALPGARVFPETWDRWTCSDWHRQTVGTGTKDTHGRETPGLRLAQRLPMKNARHHWAVRMLRAGAKIQDVQQQLGHGSAKETLDTYGRFMVDAEDRDRAEAAATAYEAKRREAK